MREPRGLPRCERELLGGRLPPQCLQYVFGCIVVEGDGRGHEVRPRLVAVLCNRATAEARDTEQVVVRIVGAERTLPYHGQQRGGARQLGRSGERSTDRRRERSERAS